MTTFFEIAVCMKGRNSNRAGIIQLDIQKQSLSYLFTSHIDFMSILSNPGNWNISSKLGILEKCSFRSGQAVCNCKSFS